MTNTRKFETYHCDYRRPFFGQNKFEAGPLLIGYEPNLLGALLFSDGALQIVIAAGPCEGQSILVNPGSRRVVGEESSAFGFATGARW